MSSYNPAVKCPKCGSQLHQDCARGEQELTPDEWELIALRLRVTQLETELDEAKRRGSEAPKAHVPPQPTPKISDFKSQKSSATITTESVQHHAEAMSSAQLLAVARDDIERLKQERDALKVRLREFESGDCFVGMREEIEDQRGRVKLLHVEVESLARERDALEARMAVGTDALKGVWNERDAARAEVERLQACYNSLIADCKASDTRLCERAEKAEKEVERLKGVMNDSEYNLEGSEPLHARIRHLEKDREHCRRQAITAKRRADGLEAALRESEALRQRANGCVCTCERPIGGCLSCDLEIEARKIVAEALEKFGRAK